MSLTVSELTLKLVPPFTPRSSASFRLNSIRVPRTLRNAGLPSSLATFDRKTLDNCSSKFMMLRALDAITLAKSHQIL